MTCFFSADLTDSKFIDANLRKADLKEAILQNADFTNANLIDADIRNSDLRKADFSDANLNFADLRGSYLKNTNFENASIIGTEIDIFPGIKLLGCPEYYPLGWRCEDNYLVRD